MWAGPFPFPCLGPLLPPSDVRDDGGPPRLACRLLWASAWASPSCLQVEHPQQQAYPHQQTCTVEQWAASLDALALPEDCASSQLPDMASGFLGLCTRRNMEAQVL